MRYYPANPMPRFVAFLRAINVGGHVVKMDQLRALAESAGLANVSTFIASGNVLFDSRKSPSAVEATIEKSLASALGYEVATMVRSGNDLAAILEYVSSNGLAANADVTLYVGFLKNTPQPAAIRAVEAMSNHVDTLAVHGRELYWQCRKSFSESTIQPPRLGRALEVPITTRNITTVRKLGAKVPPF